MEYTGAQRAAIGTLDEPLLIVACAGSGKTQVISERIVETLRRPGVEPKNIVAFTFTEKAAAELKVVWNTNTILPGTGNLWTQVPSGQYVTGSTTTSVTVTPLSGGSFFRLRKM